MASRIKIFVCCFALFFISDLRAAEPWALWSNFLDLANSTSKAPDVSSTQNEINGSGFTFNKGSGVVNSDGYMSTVGGEWEAPYIDFNMIIAESFFFRNKKMPSCKGGHLFVLRM